jgi:hypothetical protein
MKTMERGHDVLHLNSAARNFVHTLHDKEDLETNHKFERITSSVVMIPLLIVLLTLLTLTLQYYFATAHGQISLPTFQDIPLA